MSDRLTYHDYVQAIVVQDACNLAGVVHSFIRVLDRIEESFETTDGALSAMEIYAHPLVVMYASKCFSLTHADANGIVKLRDLRNESGAELLMAVRSFTHIIGEVRLGIETYEGLYSTSMLNRAPLCQILARRIAMLTACENMDVFGQAYEACKVVHDKVKGEEVKESDEVPLDELWLHQVMISSPAHAAEVIEETQPADWSCECGASGTTDMLAFLSPASKFCCPQCGNQAITAVSATLKAELKTPRMLAFAMGLLDAKATNLDKVDEDYVALVERQEGEEAPP